MPASFFCKSREDDGIMTGGKHRLHYWKSSLEKGSGEGGGGRRVVEISGDPKMQDDKHRLSLKESATLCFSHTHAHTHAHQRAEIALTAITKQPLTEFVRTRIALTGGIGFDTKVEGWNWSSW